MSYPPQPAAPNWFARLSPRRRVGVLLGAALLLCCGGAAGFVALLPGPEQSAGRRTALVEPAGPASAADGPHAAPAPATAVPTTVRPNPTPTPTSAVAATTAPSKAATQAAPKPVSYANCAAVRAAGKAPLRRGQPGYRTALDADRDGVACESATRANGGDAPNPPPKPKVSRATDPRFGTCKEAKANGYGPYTRGEPEYDWYRDADNDGKVCE
ncbi:excalibur calcium-binding domain-containing protein [Asanoa iriomotensis]|uniref:Excalibur calcium-binding domain-containing protein n=1 Tax=Asanoa iriomotensis TaxID=234613 RepID=A0ABQ4C900_9ACTN|nr:excalibur calcium-binding domain-containing protein [Asanoa iriomotensis]GIF59250.1 hypothetical protein Air01nite_53450 [Asanoa iriomotensis]